MRENVLFTGLPWVWGFPWDSHGYGYGMGMGTVMNPHGFRG